MALMSADYRHASMMLTLLFSARRVFTTPRRCYAICRLRQIYAAAASVMIYVMLAVAAAEGAAMPLMLCFLSLMMPISPV